MLVPEPEISTAPLKHCLKTVFGFDHFRGLQEQVITHLLSGKNTFVIMPTGAGKSLCYQLPALVREGTAVVISPLIALMKNQVDQLNAVGIIAHFLNSSLSKTELNRVKRDLLDGQVKLLYVAPESLTKEENIALLQKINISFVAIDEAHCISEWGHDFRPEYRRIKQIVDNLGQLPIIALTATATPKVQLDIQRNLQMEEAAVFKTSFNRPNLFYEIRAKVEARKQLIKFIRLNKGKSGIIYCLSRKKVEEIAEFLRVNDIKALPYHAGLDAAVRMRNQDAFLNEEADVIVATIAFGMGIDKPDVRFVIHYDAPKSLEGYYQETGRAGRDGLEGHCLMFYSFEDIQKLEKFNKDKTVTERDNARHLLDEMADYSNSGVCRRRQLLHYFGEELLKDCGFCDNCQKPNPKHDLQREIMLVLQAVKETEERFGSKHLADLLNGTSNDYIVSYGHDKLSSFGAGNDRTVEFWISLIRQVNLAGLLAKDYESLGVLKLNEKSLQYLDNPYKVSIFEDHDFSAADNEDEDDDSNLNNNSQRGAGADPVLFEMLQQLCKKIASQKKLPSYTIFQEPSLQEMAVLYPTTKGDLAQIVGVGQGKVEKFGAPFIELIKKYVEENDITPASDIVVKSATNKSKKKISIIQFIDRKIDLEEICDQTGLQMHELLDELEQIVYSGTKLNLSHHVSQLMDDEREAEVVDYFMTAQTDNLKEAFAELCDEYSEEEVRLVRLKFISDVAN